MRALAKQRQSRMVVMLVPAAIYILVLLALPIIMAIPDSFRTWNLLRPEDKAFVGLANFGQLLRDSTFQQSLRFTLLFVFVTLAIEIPLGIGAALVFSSIRNSIVRGIGATILFIPYMIAPLTTALIWKLLFTFNGFINALVTGLGFSPVAWFAHPVWAFVAVVIAEIWRSYPFGFLLFLAAITALPEEPYEAAVVDGASKAQAFWLITVPLLKPTLTIVLIYQMVLKLRVFDLVYLMTAGGPVDYTTPLGLLIYRYYFRYREAGIGSASALIVLVLSVLITVVIIRKTFVEQQT
jgi:multiple sugar transport system permease protein